MKLKKYNRKDCRTRMPGKPTVRITKIGTFAFNRRAASELGLNGKTKLNFMQDENRPKDWYLEKTNDEDGIQLRAYKNGFVANGADVARKIIQSLDLPASTKSIAFQVATKPITAGYYAIITSSAN